MAEADSQETTEQSLHRIANTLEALVGITASLLELQIQSLESQAPESISATSSIEKIIAEQKALLKKAQGNRG